MKIKPYLQSSWLFLHAWLHKLPNYCLLCEQTADQVLCHSCLEALVYQNDQVCIHCGLALPTFSSRRCGACLIADQHSAYERLYTALAYTTTAVPLLHKAKYQPRQALSALSQLGQLLIEQIELVQADEIDVIVPVPLHPQRLRQRGYHQTLILANYLGQHFNIPVDYHTCQMKRCLNSQATLTKTERTSAARQQRLQNNFVIGKAAKAWQRVLIVDDVITTATTVEALAQQLKKQGVQHIDVCACLRTHSPQSLQRLRK